MKLVRKSFNHRLIFLLSIQSYSVQTSNVIPMKFCNLWTVHRLILTMHQCSSATQYGVRCQRFQHAASHGFIHFCWDHQPLFDCSLTYVWKFRLFVFLLFLGSLLSKNIILTEVPKWKDFKCFCFVENKIWKNFEKKIQIFFWIFFKKSAKIQNLRDFKWRFNYQFLR